MDHLYNMPIQAISFGKKALAPALLVVANRWNRSTSACCLPWEILEIIFSMRALEGDLIRASHVCRRWRDVITSSARLWTVFQCRHLDLTQLQLARLTSTPISLVVDHRSDIRIVEALKPLTGRYRSITLRLSQWHLDKFLPLLTTPAPALEHLEISVIGCRDLNYIPETFLGGSVGPTLKSLHLCGVNGLKGISKFPSLTHLTLVATSGCMVTEELLDVFKSAMLLEEVSVKFSSSIFFMAKTQDVVRHPRIRKLSISNTFGKFPERLLFFLEMPSVEEINLDISLNVRDSRAIRDILPPQLRTFPHLLKATDLKLDFSPPGCMIKFGGPGGTVSVRAFQHDDHRKLDDLLQRSRWLSTLEPMLIADVERLTLRGFHSEESVDQLLTCGLLGIVEGVRSLIVEECNHENVIATLFSLEGGSPLFPHLESLTFRQHYEIFYELSDTILANRCQALSPLIDIRYETLHRSPRHPPIFRPSVPGGYPEKATF